MTAGHSLGEYAALAASGSLSISDAARLLRQRGDSMQSAVPVGEGAMAAILGGDEDQINAILADAKSSGLVQIANDNAPGQIVISGAAAAVDAAIEIAKAAGLRRAIKLPVSAPFHCDLMAPAADVMAKLLADTDLSDALMPGLLQCVGRCRDARRSFAGKSCHTGHGAGSVARITDGNERCRCNQIYRAWYG
jgi:[acyl-carrier-protein] S-malonyltransferase